MVRWRAPLIAVALWSLGLLAGASTASAATLELIGSFTESTFVTSDPSDETRIFVVEQDGRIRLTAGGATSVFLDMDS
jgi:hypothetical protein